MFFRHDVGGPIHRSDALFLVEIETRHAAIVEIGFEVSGVARQDHRTGDVRAYDPASVTEPSPNTSWSPSSLVTG